MSHPAFYTSFLWDLSLSHTALLMKVSVYTAVLPFHPRKHRMNIGTGPIQIMNSTAKCPQGSQKKKEKCENKENIKSESE